MLPPELQTSSLERDLRRSRRRPLVRAGIVVATLALIIAGSTWYRARPARVTYRADASRPGPGCQLSILYNNGLHQTTGAALTYSLGAWSTNVRIPKGEAAVVEVQDMSTSRRCGEVRCEILEGGKAVASVSAAREVKCNAEVGR